MEILILGLLVFYTVHLLPSFVGLHQRLITYLGQNRYTGLFALVSLIGVALVVYGFSQIEAEPVWYPPPWAHSVVVVAMGVTFYLFVAAEMPCNLKRFIRHPMLLGVVIWSTSHLWVNGDMASAVLFGSLLVFALFAMVSANLRGATRQTEHYPASNEVKVLLVSVVAYTVFSMLIHPYLIGVAIF